MGDGWCGRFGNYGIGSSLSNPTGTDNLNQIGKLCRAVEECYVHSVIIDNRCVDTWCIHYIDVVDTDVYKQHTGQDAWPRWVGHVWFNYWFNCCLRCNLFKQSCHNIVCSLYERHVNGFFWRFFLLWRCYLQLILIVVGIELEFIRYKSISIILDTILAKPVKLKSSNHR